MRADDDSFRYRVIARVEGAPIPVLGCAPVGPRCTRGSPPRAGGITDYLDYDAVYSFFRVRVCACGRASVCVWMCCPSRHTHEAHTSCPSHVSLRACYCPLGWRGALPPTPQCPSTIAQGPCRDRELSSHPKKPCERFRGVAYVRVRPLVRYPGRIRL